MRLGLDTTQQEARGPLSYTLHGTLCACTARCAPATRAPSPPTAAPQTPSPALRIPPSCGAYKAMAPKHGKVSNSSCTISGNLLCMPKWCLSRSVCTYRQRRHSTSLAHACTLLESHAVADGLNSNLHLTSRGLKQRAYREGICVSWWLCESHTLSGCRTQYCMPCSIPAANASVPHCETRGHNPSRPPGLWTSPRVTVGRHTRSSRRQL